MGAPAQRSSDSSTTAGTVAPTFSGRPPSLGILIAVTMLGPMALNIFIPSMPGMTAVFDTDYGTIQLTLTLYLAGLGIAQLFQGRSEEHTSELQSIMRLSSDVMCWKKKTPRLHHHSTN